ncbi:MAG: hypothetical protein RLZZ502_1776, partial [Pseudomonadota bacterium]
MLRSLLVLLIVMGGLPLIFKLPYIGVYLYLWISMMNPHRMTYGFAFDFPFALVLAVTTIAVAMGTKLRRGVPLTAQSGLLILFVLWMSVTSLTALNKQNLVYDQWIIVIKMMTMLFICCVLVYEKKTIHWLVWVLVGSIAFFGAKGGVFTVLTGGAYRVWGPPSSYIEGNNELALGLVALLPLMYYLYLTEKNKWIRRLIIFMMVTCTFSILGSHSRGALLALVAGITLLGLKSKRPMLTVVIIVVSLPLLIAFMPEKWTGRMKTIQTYEQDMSANQRLNTWATILNMIKDRPIVGAGFRLDNSYIYNKYSPDKQAAYHAAHSLYFQCLGEHGIPGLLIYLSLAISTYLKAGKLSKLSRQRPEWEWGEHLMRMLQASLVGFGVGGAFLGLLHWDMPYFFVALVIIYERWLKEQSAKP